MRFVLSALLLLVACFAACDETTGDPDCRTEECIVAADAGFSDTGVPFPPVDDGASTVPPPFDAGITPAPTCKGLFELCTGEECCAPNLCTNGTCR